MINATTTARFDEARLAEVRERGLMHGMHADWADGACAVEAAAYIAGEPFSDHPQCVCPVVACFVRSWNDSLPSDAERNRLLIPLLPHIVGTRDSDTTAARRSWMALDWLVRVHTPAFMALSADLHEHAAALRALSEIDSGDRIVEARPVIAAARAAAEDDVAYTVARAAARAAAKAAGDAAFSAAGTEVRGAGRDAARAAARDAAREAARAAAGGALQPTVVELQESAADLVRRMCSITEI